MTTQFESIESARRHYRIDHETPRLGTTKRYVLKIWGTTSSGDPVLRALNDYASRTGAQLAAVRYLRSTGIVE
jgi:hypothetical protein